MRAGKEKGTRGIKETGIGDKSWDYSVLTFIACFLGTLFHAKEEKGRRKGSATRIRGMPLASSVGEEGRNRVRVEEGEE